MEVIIFILVLLLVWTSLFLLCKFKLEDKWEKLQSENYQIQMNILQFSIQTPKFNLFFSRLFNQHNQNNLYIKPPTSLSILLHSYTYFAYLTVLLQIFVFLFLIYNLIQSFLPTPQYEVAIVPLVLFLS